MRHVIAITTLFSALGSLTSAALASETSPELAGLAWETRPPLPNELGVAGPFVGVHNDALIVAGGANFPRPVWETNKQWVSDVHVLLHTNAAGYQWRDGGKLARPIAYGASVSIPEGVVCLGGNDASETFAEAFLISWDLIDGISVSPLPPLPRPCAFGYATTIGRTVYLAGGQSGADLSSAMNNFWSLDFSQKNDERAFRWHELPAWPGPSRALNITVSQHDGFHNSVYVMSGRRQEGDTTQFLNDVWQYTPATGQWRARASSPRCIMAGCGIGFGQSHIFVLGGADGSLFHQADQLRDEHPGFPKQALAYHTITDSWIPAGTLPANQVTTNAVRWGDQIIVASGEIRPRVRAPQVWATRPLKRSATFGTWNYLVLFSYLAAMVGVGLYFANKNRSTDDYFRASKRIPWWAAGCSIFATMLSSLTYTGIPSKAYAQDWVYAVGNMMIPVIAFVAVFVALPFYRAIDVTSAYEYLEKRFNRAVRMFGSGSFALFHVFRMAIVMSLTGLALAVATPLTPAQSVLLMGVLSIIYCTLGGIEAVIWTDTIQTVVLLGGALISLGILISGADGGFTGMLSMSQEAGKFNWANFHWDITSPQIALWVIVVGAMAQNTSSYTADQAVVQRYMTTSSQQLAARSIWTNAIMSIFATILFFGIGSALFAFYRSHPDRLDPTITTDQIFPLFVARELPVGLAGLIIAGVFSAAQSTVSTSMNSTATTIVTDFLRPIHVCQTEEGYLRAAQLTTLMIGVCGTMLGLVFVNPEILSLFDAFVKVIGMFLGVLGGLFMLGMLTKRATGMGAMVGAVAGSAVMICLWQFTSVNGYFYTASGITSCFAAGYLVSLLTGPNENDLSGLTIHTMSR